MTERERWIVYPLLFLALGAALRDKIIKTTQSQLVKCEALCVVDKDGQPVFVLGAEKYPELARTKRDFMRISELQVDRLAARQKLSAPVVAADHLSVNQDLAVGLMIRADAEEGFVQANQLRGVNIRNRDGELEKVGRVGTGVLEAEVVVARNYVLTDGEHQLPILGKYTEPLLAIYKAITAQYELQRANALRRATDTRGKQRPKPDSQQPMPASERPVQEPAAEPSPPPEQTSPPASESATEDPPADEPNPE